MRAGVDNDPAGANFFFTREQTGFDDDFDGPFFGGLDDIAQFAQNVGALSILVPADIHDHINLLRVIVNRGFGFKAFRIGIGRAEREANDRDHLDVTAMKKMAGLSHPRSVHANGVEIMGTSLGAEFLDVLERGLRLQQGVIDVTREVFDELQGSSSGFRTDPQPVAESEPG